ncbi:beta-farnesene synthase [Phtheirospermum japonicum]|uniref:Beta-farnesene synthase n=1 Tax=Phtheirospermum japonicum TaxID=374723 RepID=A0A830BI21_9LAMI|nr:beta-farnesene synthase [Phtheirospermum japonicum]
MEQKNAEAIETLKEEAKSMLIRAKAKTTADKLILIDTLERLGVGYHFDQEIEEQLQEVFKSHYENIEEEKDHDLFITSLQFRLLRQHRHYISCSVFDKFTGKDNKFNENLSDDAKGLLSLYEAAHLRIHGEPILDEAVAFTTHHLKRIESSPLEDQVKRALVHPIHRGSPRIHTHNYISFYEKDSSGNDLLLKLAKLDFNYVQNMYKKDICEVSRWWNELKSSFPYARDRIVEAYLWGTTFHFEPQYSYVRKTIAKTIQILTILDDTYDIYATVEEADLFNENFQRWNIDEIHQLPDYMKIIYRIILSTYEDYERDAAEQGKLFAAPSAKEAMKQVCKAYNKEIKWTTRQELPCFEEYIENSVMAGCFFAICSMTIPGMKSVTKETVDWLMSVPNIIVASSKVC